MRILYYSPNPNLNLHDPAGYGTHMREMIHAFRQLGHEVEVHIMGGTTPRGTGGTSQPSLFKRIAKAIIPRKHWQTMKDQRLLEFDDHAYDGLMARIQQFNPDMIYERGNYLQTSGVNAARKMKVMHVLEMNSPYVEEKVELEGVSRLLAKAKEKEAWQLAKTDHIVVVSSSLKEYFMAGHRIFEGKFTLIPNAIDPEKGRVEPGKLADLRRRHALEGKIVIGWVGSIQPWHGMEELILTFSNLARQDPRLALMIVGGGETLLALKQCAAESGVGERIHFTDGVPHAEVFTHLAAMDICVLPNTNWYGSPIKIFEYGMMGKAILATHHATVLDVMVPGQDGIVIAPGSKALQEGLERLVADPGLRQRLGTHFQEKVLREHTWLANARRVCELWEFSQTSVKR
ncbi:MAG: hypothetical protein RLZZ165_894 [Bacteroidota bacterium]|jgi:glycosyltransferase involved in cell wall biosynthesis